jgi:uncharacterized protein YcnI
MIKRLSSGLVAAAIGGALIGVFGFANASAAHVRIEPKEATQGGYETVVFRMSNERDHAATVRLVVHMPEDQPITSVRTMNIAGWNVKVTMRKLDKSIEAHDGGLTDQAVDTITWTATRGHALKGSTFVQLPVSIARLPEVDVLTFQAIQTYDNGEVVRWVEEGTEDGKEPKHPAPVLRLNEPSTMGAVQPLSAGNPAAVDPPGYGGYDDTSETPAWLNLIGLVAGLGGFAFGGFAFARFRRNFES